MHVWVSEKKDYAFCRAIRKYGKENFLTEILEVCSSREEMFEREIYWISELRPKYNMTPGGEVPPPMFGEDNPMYGRRGELSPLFGRERSEEWCQNLSKALTGYKKTEEHIRKIAEAQRGKKISEETREKLSVANSGENNGFFGRKHTEESIRKMLDSKKNKIMVQCVETGKIYESVRAASRELGIDRTSIRRVMLGKAKSASGLHFIKYEH